MKPSLKAHLATVLVCLGVVAVAGASVAQARMTPAQAIAARQAGFKAQGAALKTIVDQIRAPQPDIAAIRRAANTLNANAAVIGNWFPAGSGPESGIRTRALPKIWSEPQDFQQKVNAFRTAAPALKAAADSGDINAIRQRFGPVAQSCGGCHNGGYRAEER